MAKGADAERRFSNLPAAAAVLVCCRRGVLQLLALGNGQVVEHLARGGAKASRAKVSSTSDRGRVALGSRWGGPAWSLLWLGHCSGTALALPYRVLPLPRVRTSLACRQLI